MSEPRPLEDPTAIDPETESGVPWAINRYVYHPRGFALAFHFDESKKLVGWSLLGDGSEVLLEATLAAYRTEPGETP